MRRTGARAHRRTVSAALLVVALATSAAAQEARQRQAPPPGGQPRDFWLAEPRTFTLDNGMGVTLVQYGTVPKAGVQLNVRAGNLNESASEVWLSDLAADLMQEGTTSRTAAQVAEQAAGMGGQVFVNVGLDESGVGGDVLAEFAPDFVRLVADIARNPAFPAGELPRLKANRARNLTVALRQPGSITLARLREALYPDHPYGRTFPTAEQLNGYTVEQIRAFHAANWGAARAHLTVVGIFDGRAVEAAIREALGSWAGGPAALTNVPSPVAHRDLLTSDRPGAPQSTLAIAIPVANPSSPDWIPLVVTNTMLGGYFSSRITANIREDKGYTYSPNSAVSTRYRDSYWVQNADVTTAQTGPSLREIFYEIDRIRAEAPPGAELADVQNYLAGTFVLSNSTRGGIAGQLTFVRFHGLDRSYLTNYVRNVFAVTSADVHRIALLYLDPARMLITVTGDLTVIRDQLAPYQRTAP